MTYNTDKVLPKLMQKLDEDKKSILKMFELISKKIELLENK